MKQSATIKQLTEENKMLSNEVDRYRMGVEAADGFVSRLQKDIKNLKSQLSAAATLQDELQARVRELEVQTICVQEENDAIRCEYKQNVERLKQENDKLKKQLDARCLNHISETLEEETRG